MDNSNWDAGQNSPSIAEHLESPFLREEILLQEHSEEWESPVTRLEAESPFGRGLEHVQATALDTELLDPEVIEWETGKAPQSGVSSVAVNSIKQWPDRENRPASWQGRIYGLVVHTSGSGIPKRAEKDRVSPTTWAIRYYKTSRGCHYVNGWGGIESGDLVQIANEGFQARGVGFSNPDAPSKGQRQSIKAGRFEMDLPQVLVKLWRKRWPSYKDSLELLPGTATANSCYVHVECLPSVYHGQKSGLTIGAPPLQTRPKLRFTKAQHDAVAHLAVDIARRNDWPMSETWWRSPRLLGHEDLTPISRHDKNGGWDPGYLREEPYFDWDYVYRAIESILQAGGSVPTSASSSIGSGLIAGLGSAARSFLDLMISGKERLAISLAYRQGTTDENNLTSLVFHARHPELAGRRIRKEEHSLAQEWLKIRDELVRPFLQSATAAKTVPELQEAFLEEAELFEPFIGEWEDLDGEDFSTDSPSDLAGEEEFTVDLEGLETADEQLEDEFSFEQTIDEANIELEDLESEENFSDDAEFESEEEEDASDYEELIDDAEGEEDELPIETEQDDLAGEQELDERFGKSIYLPIKLNNTVPPKVGVFVPGSFRPTTSVNLIVYFHGHMIPDCEKNPKKFGEAGMEYYWNTPLFKNLREELAMSGKQAILIAPTLDPFLSRSADKYGNLNQAGKFDRLITETISGLEARGILPPGSNAKTIILSGHSGGGRPMLELLSARNSLRENIIECWGFECLYFGTKGWDNWLKSNSQHYFIHFRRPSFKKEATASLINFKNFRDVPTATGHCGIIRDKWREAIQKSRVFNEELASSSPATSVEQPTGLLSLLNKLPGFPILPSSFLDALNNGNRDENHLTNLVFFSRHRELEGRKLSANDPQSLKDEWVEIRQSIVRPALRSLQAGGSGYHRTNSAGTRHAAVTSPGKGLTTSNFDLSEYTLANEKIELVSYGDKKKNTAVSIVAAPAQFLPQIIRMASELALKDKKDDLAARLDHTAWFRKFTQITFLGRKLTSKQYVHVETAQLLKSIEAEMVKKYGGDAKSVGDILLLNSDESIAGSRKVSSTATYSMHMFGLAIDVNYLGNPFIQARAIATLNSALSSAARLLNRAPLSYNKDEIAGLNAVGDRFERIQLMDSMLERYFSLLDQPTELERLIQASSSQEWRGLAGSGARDKIQNHLDKLSGLLARGNKRKNYFKQHAILNFDKRFVVQMEEMGMHWGGQYGDMMHFDMRKSGVGYYVNKARLKYSEQVRDLAKKLLSQKTYGTFPAPP